MNFRASGPVRRHRGAAGGSLRSAATRLRRRDRSEGLRRVTIEEVAALAAVSTATVSRTLAHPDAVSEALTARVRAAVARLGYVPNAAARALASRHGSLVGVLVPDLADPVHARTIEALERQLAAKGFGLLLAVTGGDPVQEAAEARRMAGRGVEGWIVIGGVRRTGPDAPGRDRCVAIVARRTGDAGERVVAEFGFDDSSAGYRVGYYLGRLGHREVAWLDPVSMESADGGAARIAYLAGIRAGLSAGSGEGAQSRVRRVLGGGGARARDDEVRAAIRAWFAESIPPTAVVCGDDLGGLAVLQACAGLGVRVPGTVSVVGCGDQPSARLGVPPLTTLRRPTADLARAVAAGLLALGTQASPAGTPARTFRCQLVIRGSTGPAATSDGGGSAHPSGP